MAFSTLLGVMTAHALLETARDALFLSKLAARELPWAYVAIAVLALGATSASARLRELVPRRATLPVSLVAGGLVTAGFGFLAASPSRPVLIALYVWTGLLATVVVVEFWLRVAQVLDFGQAKRLFAIIGAGGLTGAVLGAALSFALLVVLPPTALLFVAGALLVVTAAVPVFFSGERAAAAPPRAAADTRSWLALLRSEPYLLRLLWVALASSMVLTGVDFVFKSEASVDLAPDQLGPFFARFYAGVGGLALLVQLFVAPRLLRVLGVNGSLLLFPGLLLLGSGGFVLTGSLGAALLMRGTDGALRHSLHRTGTEILYVPLSPSIRDRFKGFVEAVGQRGGQGLASVLLLGGVEAGARPVHVGVGLIALGAAWLGATSGIKPHYLELFRRNLRQGAIETHAEVPDLDLHALETLIASLSSHNDQEVMGALELLAAYGKTNLVPALILYHPSTDVVLHAFQLLSAGGRPDVDRLLERLVRHEDERVRAAALRHSAADADTALLEAMSADPSPLVRTTAVVELIVRGKIDEREGGDVLRDIIDAGTPELRRALAFAARGLPRGRYAWALVRLAEVREPGLAVEVARSMAAAPDVEYVPTLVRLLAQRDCREDARTAILALGDAALESLDRALSDATLPRAVRRHLPRTIARFPGRKAADVLSRHLALEAGDALSLGIVRALGRLRDADPTIRVDTALLMQEAKRALERAVTLLFYRVTSERAVAENVAKPSAGAEMLSALLSDKEKGALERVFRILKVVDPSEEFEVLFTALTSEDGALRENGRELLRHVVPEPLRTGTLAMLGDGPPDQRLREAARFYDPEGRARLDQSVPRSSFPGRDGARAELAAVHVDCLRRMLHDPSESLRGVASYRIAELGLAELGAELPPAASDAGALAELSEEALGLFERREGEVTRAG